MMNKKLWLPMVAIAATAVSAVASAVPIVYAGSVGPGPAVAGATNQGPSNENNPVGAQYYSFNATAGSAVTITGDRTSGAFDMAFWIFSGVFTDTSQFGATFDSGDAGFIAFGDDEQLIPNVPGPFSDPFSSFVAPVSGSYTIAVTSYLSSSTPPPAQGFLLSATGVNSVPEPATLTLLGLGLLGLGAARRSRKR